jgi:DNA mismatch repair protein MutL
MMMNEAPLPPALDAAERESPVGGIASPEGRRIRLLPPEEARKIAAGEVVDRPAALVREFLDNAIDAGSSLIETLIEEGGIRRIEVIDDGEGMTKEDLALCWQTHATSKIRSVEDLNTAETLGFRGEALAAAAAVSRLEIVSAAGGEAWALTVGPGEREGARLERSRRAKGTSVRARGIFDTIPARKRFLKREGSEGGLCRQVFTDKALAFPGIGFRFIQDGQLKTFLPPAASFKERFALALLSRNEGAFLHEINAQGPGFSVVILAGGPELYRRDRRQQYVFANGRRITDFSLLQALEYGLQGWFPNGLHPVGAVYVDIDPALADFNIHPAKREVRFKDPGAIHHAITAALQDFAHRRNSSLSRGGAELSGKGLFPEPAFPGPAGGLAGGLAGENPAAKAAGNSGGFAGGFSAGNGGLAGGEDRSSPYRASSSLAMEALLENRPAFAPPPGRDAGFFAREEAPPYGETGAGETAAPRFVGRLFNLFILIERGDRLFIIDQHAAHERILFDRFLSAGISQQELLVPIPFSTEGEEDDRFLRESREALAKLGVLIAEDGDAWRIEALPVNWRMGDAETVREILGLRQAREDMARRWAATLCCHGAIKDGDYLDETTALALAEAAFRLPVPFCPHGRPIWWEISREDLFRTFKRI